MGWIEDAINASDDGSTGFRAGLMALFNTSVNTLRADGFNDVEVYHLMLGLFDEQPYWSLFEYWCETFLDWDDELEVEK